jgi:hypothetical protein
VRRAFTGTGPFPVLALVAAAVGTMFLVLTLNSIGGLIWTGTAVKGQEESGLVYFRYHGQVYTVDDPGSFRSGPRTVYIDPHDPTRSTLNSTIAGGLQAAVVFGPYLAAAVFTGLAVSRKWRYVRRRREAIAGGAETYGTGVDEATMAWLLDRQRYGVHARPRPAPGAASPWEPPARPPGDRPDTSPWDRPDASP